MRKLKLKINEKDYTLEMNRDSIKWLEAMGFDIDEFEIDRMKKEKLKLKDEAYAIILEYKKSKQK